MKPIDFRNETWANIKERMLGLRMEVWIAWCKHGPGTTREISRKSGIDILTLRPRATELFELGFIELVPGQSPSRTGGKGDRAPVDGIYRAVQWSDAMERFNENKRQAQTFQPDLFGSGPSRTGPALRSR